MYWLLHFALHTASFVVYNASACCHCVAVAQDHLLLLFSNYARKTLRLMITVEVFAQFYKKQRTQPKQKEEAREKKSCEHRSTYKTKRNEMKWKEIQSGRLIKNGRCAHLSVLMQWWRAGSSASPCARQRCQINRYKMTCFGCEQYAVNVRAMFLFNFIHWHFVWVDNFIKLVLVERGRTIGRGVCMYRICILLFRFFLFISIFDWHFFTI